MQQHIVYWYHLANHTDPYTEGYVGVTCREDERHRAHLSGYQGGSKILHYAFNKYGVDQVQKTVLHRVSKQEAYELEQQYRPEMNVGWNIAMGGGLPPDTTGRVDSPEVRQKRAASVRKAREGKKYPSPFKGATTRYTAKQRALIGSYHKGKTISDSHKQAIRDKNSGANSPHAREIHLVHRDSLDHVYTFPCVKTAAAALGINYNTLRSQAQRVFRQEATSDPSHSGWFCLAPQDLADVETAIANVLSRRSQRFKSISKVSGKAHSKAKHVVLQHLSGESIHFDTYSSAAAHIGISEATLRYHIAQTNKHQRDSNYMKVGWKVIYQQAVELRQPLTN